MLKDISKMEQRYDAVTMVMREGFHHRHRGQVQRVSPNGLPLAGQIRRRRFGGAGRRVASTASRAAPNGWRARGARAGSARTPSALGTQRDSVRTEEGRRRSPSESHGDLPRSGAFGIDREGRNDSEVLFDKICRENGINPWTDSGGSTMWSLCRGCNDRFHWSDIENCLRPHVAADLSCSTARRMSFPSTTRVFALVRRR